MLGLVIVLVRLFSTNYIACLLKRQGGEVKIIEDMVKAIVGN
jgi:hypothetical protein